MKNMTVAVAVAIIGCVLAVSANVTTSKMHQNLNKERYERMVAESQLQNAQNKIKKMQAAVEEARGKIENIQKILNIGQSAKTDLVAQLDNMKNDNVALKQKIQQVDIIKQENQALKQEIQRLQSSAPVTAQ